MLISFIITYYNEPVTMLRECLDSILAVNLLPSEREIILVDDGSEASPLDQIDDYKDHIRYIRQNNQGPGAARNHGIDIAQGQYIQFVDADDCLLPAYSECMETVKAQQPDVLMFHGRHTKRYMITTSGTDFMLHHNMRGAACCIIFRKAALGTLRYDTELINEDELFNAQLLLQCTSLIDVGLHAYYYRQRDNSRSHSNDSQRLKRRLDDAETIIRRLNRMCDDLTGNAKAALQRRVCQLTMDYIYNTVKQTHSLNELTQRSKRLRRHKLLPLPIKPYTTKYLIFSIITRLTL